MRKRDLIAMAREMRRNPTPSEDAFWQAVRDKGLSGVKFRRQQVIDRFIVDFFAPSHRLVVEIDGAVHRGREEHDAPREQFLEDCGLRVLRLRADDVEHRLDEVLEVVRGALRDHEHGAAGIPSTGHMGNTTPPSTGHMGIIPPLRLPERGQGGEA